MSVVKLKMLLFLWIFGSMPAVIAQTLKLPSENFKLSVDHVVEQQLDIQKQIAYISSQYNFHFGNYSSGLSGLSKEDLLLYFDVTNVAFFYTHDLKYAILLEKIFIDLRQKEIAEEKHFEKIYGMYITLRDIQKAVTFWTNYKNLPTANIPKIFDGAVGSVASPKLWRLDSAKRALITKNFNKESGLQIVVLVNPLCQFSKNFFDAFISDDKLSEIFAANVLYLIPPEGTMHFEAVSEWNNHNPKREMIWANSRLEWPSIQFWQTPSFYFYLDGNLVDSVSGWPKEGNREAIAEVLKKIKQRKN